MIAPAIISLCTLYALVGFALIRSVNGPIEGAENAFCVGCGILVWPVLASAYGIARLYDWQLGYRERRRLRRWSGPRARVVKP